MKTERISIAVEGGQMGAYVARPDSDKAPAVVVLQEIFGVNAAMREITEGLAGQGYLAICPDLFWRIQPGIDITDAQMDKAFEYMGKFDADMGVKDIQATIDHIRQDGQCTGKVGAVGFCLGGRLAFLTALRTDAEGAVSYYGVGLEKLVDQADSLSCPVMLHIAEEDGFVSKDAQAQIKSALDGNPKVQIHSYPGRDHAFARPGGAHYDQADADKAGRRSLDFFKAHLS